MRLHAEYAAELARQLVFEVFRDETYTRGLNVTTTIRRDDQDSAYAALRRQVLEYDRKYGYRGPEAFIDLTSDPATRDQRIEDALVEAIDSPNLFPAVVLEASPTLVRVAPQGGAADRYQGRRTEIRRAITVRQGPTESKDRSWRGRARRTQ